MKFENNVKTLLKAGRAAFGASMIDRAEMVAKFTVNCGVDFLWIDLEHRSFGTHEVRWLPIICRQAGCAAMIRVPGLDSSWTKKALDIGANTIMFPQINTADEAKLAVEYTKYPPEGTRGITPVWALMMDVPFEEYLPVANDEKCVVVQIESPQGMKNLDEICQVEGVDVVFAGPADLSASLGVIGQSNHPDLLKYLAEFPKRVEAHGKPAGITFSALDRCQQAYEQGYRFINVGALAHHGMAGLTKIVSDFRAQDS